MHWGEFSDDDDDDDEDDEDEDEDDDENDEDKDEEDWVGMVLDGPKKNDTYCISVQQFFWQSPFYSWVNQRFLNSYSHFQ